MGIENLRSFANRKSRVKRGVVKVCVFTRDKGESSMVWKMIGSSNVFIDRVEEPENADLIITLTQADYEKAERKVGLTSEKCWGLLWGFEKGERKKDVVCFGNSNWPEEIISLIDELAKKFGSTAEVAKKRD